MSLLEFLKPMPIIGILRDIPIEGVEDCIRVVSQSELKAIEVTMNTAAAEEIIKCLKVAAEPHGIAVGAGTVRHLNDLEKALAAGAEFIVTPNTQDEIIRKSNEAKIPIIAGALTPTEVERAFDLGACAVKVFPVNCVGGPKYIKELRGPFRDIPLMACGGVNAENAKDYLNAGANLLAFGGSIFNAKLMNENQWDKILPHLTELLNAVKTSF